MHEDNAACSSKNHTPTTAPCHVAAAHLGHALPSTETTAPDTLPQPQHESTELNQRPKPTNSRNKQPQHIGRDKCRVIRFVHYILYHIASATYEYETQITTDGHRYYDDSTIEQR